VTNKPKAIGTKAETATLKRVKRIFPRADRAALHGSGDIGDLLNTGRFCFEVKGGEAARNACASSTSREIDRWYQEAVVEAHNAGVRYPVLVVQRRGVNYPDAGRWWAIVSAADFADIMGAGGHQNTALLRIELDELLDIIGDMGLGEEDAAA
jgi:hypothetical protein